METKETTIGMISLGCDKNRVDSEKILAFLADEYNISPIAEEADVLIINTCAFLESARKEAIQTVFDYVGLKKSAKLKKIIMTGCLPQKYISELFDELVEVDAFLGTFDQTLIKYAIEKTLSSDERLNLVGKGSELKRGRFLTTPPHYAYLKIAEGCNNFCTYCLIPKIRGKYRSYPIDELIEEAKGLGDVRELILVAQDTAAYGEDEGENRFVELLRRITELDNVGSVRILYAYPERITDALIGEIKNNEKIIHYLDVPFQHAAATVLKRMNRKGGFEENLALVNKLKSEIEDIAIRSTFITGFPDETEEEHAELLRFIREAKLFNAGFFTYSREKDTPAYRMKGQIPEKIKLQRQKELYAAQKQVASEIISAFVGKTIDVTCDGIDYDRQSFVGRAAFSAPEIDGAVYFTSDSLVEQGKSYPVFVTKADEYDLFGVIKNESSK